MKAEGKTAILPSASPVSDPVPFSHYPAIPPPVKVPLVSLGAHPCPYLPARTSESRALWGEGMPAGVYQQFMDAGFRRSGKLVYQPVCRACRACVPIRVPVNTFHASKSQRRCWRRNQDLVVTADEPVASDEKYELYLRYLSGRHGRAPGDETRETFESFLYDSPVDTAEFTYRDAGGRLLGVGLCDVTDVSLSSVYFYYEPSESRRGLGTFGAFYEIDAAARLGLPYYYLGYWVDGCASMQYKADFRPAEVLGTDGVWRPLERVAPPAQEMPAVR